MVVALQPPVASFYSWEKIKTLHSRLADVEGLCLHTGRFNAWAQSAWDLGPAAQAVWPPRAMEDAPAPAAPRWSGHPMLINPNRGTVAAGLAAPVWAWFRGRSVCQIALGRAPCFRKIVLMFYDRRRIPQGLVEAWPGACYLNQTLAASVRSLQDGPAPRTFRAVLIRLAGVFLPPS